MFEEIEYMRHNITGYVFDSDYMEICWEDIDGQDDECGGMVWVNGIYSHKAY